jgi:Icc-related predicted phosphoesterase
MGRVTRILAISDEIDRRLTVARMREAAPDLVVACGDLPFDYLELVSGAVNRPLLFVPGNHDPDLSRRRDPFVAVGAGPAIRLPDFESSYDHGERPLGATNLDGLVHEEKGLVFAGLGGSIRYRAGSNMYTEEEMRRRVRRLVRRARRSRRRVDVVITHSPPRHLGDGPDDAHRGFESFHLLIERLRPRFLLHGHVHPHGVHRPDRVVDETRIVNVIPYTLVEV